MAASGKITNIEMLNLSSRMKQTRHEVNLMKKSLERYKVYITHYLDLYAKLPDSVKNRFDEYTRLKYQCTYTQYLTLANSAAERLLAKITELTCENDIQLEYNDVKNKLANVRQCLFDVLGEYKILLEACAESSDVLELQIAELTSAFYKLINTASSNKHFLSDLLALMDDFYEAFISCARTEETINNTAMISILGPIAVFAQPWDGNNPILKGNRAGNTFGHIACNVIALYKNFMGVYVDSEHAMKQLRTYNDLFEPVKILHDILQERDGEAFIAVVNGMSHETIQRIVSAVPMNSPSRRIKSGEKFNEGQPENAVSERRQVRFSLFQTPPWQKRDPTAVKPILKRRPASDA